MIFEHTLQNMKYERLMREMMFLSNLKLLKSPNKASNVGKQC